MDHDVFYDQPLDIHDYGSNSFMFYDAIVKGTVTTDGKEAKSSDNDILEIVTNIDVPLAKLVDLDVDCQMHSTLYGMKFGIRSQKSGHLLMYGDWTPCVLLNNIWSQLTCFNDRDHCMMNYSSSGERFSSQSSTTLTNIKWAPESELPSFLSTFKTLAKENNILTIRITLQSFKYSGRRAELGWVKGVIGIPSDEDTLCIPGQRIMLPVDNSAPKGLTYDICEHCMYNGKDTHRQNKTWLGATPFKVQIEGDGEIAHISVDFSSTVVMDNRRKIRDIKNWNLWCWTALISMISKLLVNLRITLKKTVILRRVEYMTSKL